MSILIKGMEMPKTCGECRFSVDGWCYAIANNDDQPGYIKPYEKAKWCPLVPVPPHGRLIDADVLMLMIQEYIDEYGWDVDEHGFHSEKWCAMKETEMAINDAPTVIPADKGGET